MPPQKFSSLYGPTGLGTRFEIAEDPRRIIPIRPIGGMFDKSNPAQSIGLNGSSSYYPSAQSIATSSPITSGLKNLIHNGAASYSLGNAGSASSATYKLLLGGTGAGSYDAILDTNSTAPPYAFIHTLDFPSQSPQRVLMVNGEVVHQTTDLVGTYGAAKEEFTVNKAGTVDAVTNGDETITFTGSTLTTMALSAATYAAYTPSKNTVRPGDIISITQGANIYWHRIDTVTDNTHLEVYPPWRGTTAGSPAGLTYHIYRTGYSSYSRIVPIFNSANGLYYLYYVGNYGVSETDYGILECVTMDSSGGSVSHFTGPQTTAPLDVKAVDIAYYKNFMLYGAGSAISWSVAGFPTSFTTGFGATDFPSGNITVVDNTDFFISFEMLGDQLVAIFSNGIWLVQPTGSVPEFNFYRMPETTGAERYTASGSQVPELFMRVRPSCSARNSVYYTSKEGLSKLQGGTSEAVSDPIVATASLSLTGTSVPALSCTWEPFTDSVIWHNGGKYALAMYTRSGDWFIQQITDTITGLSGSVRGMTGNIVSNFDPTNRRYTVGYWHSGDSKLRFFDQSIGGPMAGHANPADWAWQTPLICLPDTYGEGFMFGGFQIEGQNLGGVAWSVYGGNEPSVLTLLDSGTIPSSPDPTLTSRKRWSKKLDVPYVGFVLSGVLWAQIVGINLYPAQIQAGR